MGGARYKKPPMSRANTWPRPAQQAPAVEDVSDLVPLMKLLYHARPMPAVGVCAAFLFHVAEKHPEALRRVLNEPIVHQGFAGTSLIAELTRIAR